jgi:hypothetical protein
LKIPNWFQARRFLEFDQPEINNCLWWLCLLTDRDKMKNLYKGPSIDASYQVSVHGQAILGVKPIINFFIIFY